MPEVKKASSGTGLPKNQAAALSYVLGFVSGIIFFILEKDEFVRFHAMQSIVAFGVLTIISFIPVIGWILTPVIMLLGFVLWLFLIFKAYQGEKYKLPYVGEFAEKQLKKF
ncbi:MAG: DUF4870 domain-containing protein [bacterium]|nr:DUF4870 domain-containing protein [bacterium]